jgi:preprotein translocase subunit SecD
MNGLHWRLGLALVILVAAGILVLPSVPGVRESRLGRLLPDTPIQLGLDLRGGIHLTLEVDLDAALRHALGVVAGDLRAAAREKGVTVLRPRVVGNDTVECTVLGVDRGADMDALLHSRFASLDVVRREATDGGVRYVLTPTPAYRKQVHDLTVDQALKTIRNRVDAFGVSEPDIRKQGGGRIQVQLPGLSDTARAIALVGRTAHLEFRLVDEGADPEAASRGVVPPESELLFMTRATPSGETRVPIVLRRETALTGEYITDASVQFDSFGHPYVAMTFNPRGARLFEELTAANVKKRMAIVLDGTVYSAPVIQERIAGGRASITGQFSSEEAHDLAVVLRSGSLPAPVRVLEERTVGPSLGQESIEKGMRAAVVGTVLLVLFMALYYGVSGVVADVAVILDVLLIMAGLALFGGTLTMPGIAGIILTLGMAVDANVLIFERIREELRRGLSPGLAVEEGFGRATLTIVDANLTTLIAAAILYQFGTGPIRGFAVTLGLGIVASMFTAIFVSRILFDLWLRHRTPGAALSI